jgi:uncharacterized membrane protein
LISQDGVLSDQLEQLLARLLHYGTLGASAVAGAGLALAFAWSALGLRIASAGIAMFILLPVLRVGVMLVFFLRVRDFRYGAIAALVLAIISISFLVGAR